jgi:enoyl-CoA hydratase/carnithine racemase
MKTKLLSTLSAVLLFMLPIVGFGQAPNLGVTSTFALFTGTGAFDNTGASYVTGDIGSNVSPITGFPNPGTVVGLSHQIDAVSAQASIDVNVAYGQLSELSVFTVLGTTMGSGQVLKSGIYHTGAATTINGDLILDGEGDANALFIIKIGGALSTGTFANIVLRNSASMCNVFWQVEGQFNLGESSVFRGTIVADGAINLLEGSSLLGRGLTRAGAISLHNNVVSAVLKPAASVITAGGATTFCAGGSVVLSGNVGGTWSNGATTAAITVTTAGDYYVTNTNACGSAISNHIAVTLTPAAMASVITANGATSFCAGGSVVLSGNVGGTWSTGATTAAITVSTAGDYYVTNTTTCGSATSNHVAVTLTSAATASVITAGGPIAFCAGGNVILSGNVGGTWSTGATTAAITVSTAGNYYVTNTNTCGSVTSNHIVVSITPAATASVITAATSTALCNGGSVVLSGNVGGTWSTGATTASLTVTTAGDFYVTNTNACGSITSNHIAVTLSSSLTASVITASGPLTFCAGGNIVLSGNLGGIWSTGATTPTITVSTAGNYYVTNSNTCSSVTSNHIVVSITPAATASVITASSSIVLCNGGSVVLSGNVGGTWSTGATTATLTVTTAGDYFVTNINSCGSVTSNHIIVTSSPAVVASVITAGGATTFCVGGNVVLSGNVGGTWSNGATTVTISVATAGDFYVTNTNICGSVTSNHIAVTINPLASVSVITASGSLSLCEGSSIILSGNVGGTWSNGATTATITVSEAGNYFVTNTNSCGSVTSNHLIVTTSPLPSATTGANAVICDGNTVMLGTTGIVGHTYLWSPATGLNDATIANPIASPTVTTTYTLTEKITLSGCQATKSVLVTVNAIPTVSTAACLGGSVSFSATAFGTDVTYQWRKGETNLVDGGNVSGATSSTLTINPVAISDASANYNVVITGACASIVTPVHLSLVVFNAPVIVTQPVSQTPCVGTAVSLSVSATGIGVTYQWRKGTSNLINGGNISGANTSKLTINSVNSFDDANDYNVVVKGACSAVTTTSTNTSISLCTQTGISPLRVGSENNAISIYPNPSKSFINIDVLDASKLNNAELKLYDTMGKMVVNTNLTQKLTILKTDIFPKGIYLYKVMDNNKTIQSGKLIFQK